MDFFTKIWFFYSQAIVILKKHVCVKSTNIEIFWCKPKLQSSRCPKLYTKTGKNTIVDYVDYQISVTHLTGPKGDMQAAKRDWNAPPPRDLNIWLCGETNLRCAGISGIRMPKTVGATVLDGFWTLEWASHADETNLRCAGISGIRMPNPSIVDFIVSEITAFIRTDGGADMAKSTRLNMLIKNTRTWGTW